MVVGSGVVVSALGAGLGVDAGVVEVVSVGCCKQALNPHSSHSRARRRIIGVLYARTDVLVESTIAELIEIRLCQSGQTVLAHL